MRRRNPRSGKTNHQSDQNHGGSFQPARRLSYRAFDLPGDAAIEDHVIAKPSRREGLEAEGVGEPSYAEIADRFFAAADQLGRDGDDETINQSLRQQRRDDARTAFDQDGLDAARLQP